MKEEEAGRAPELSAISESPAATSKSGRTRGTQNLVGGSSNNRRADLQFCTGTYDWPWCGPCRVKGQFNSVMAATAGSVGEVSKDASCNEVRPGSSTQQQPWDDVVQGVPLGL